MSKTKQPDGTVHQVIPGVTAWPFVNPVPGSGPAPAPAPAPEPAPEPAHDAASFIDSSEQDARRLRRARMLPDAKNGPLSAQHIEEVRLTVKRAREELGLTNASLAKEIGQSPSVVSQFLSGSYAGDNDALARKLNAAVERLARVEEARLPADWFNFDQAGRMLKVINAAVAERQLGVITAPSGGCKTTVLDAAKRLHPGSVLVRVSAGSKSAGGMLRAIARSLGTRYTGNAGAVLDAIVAELNGTSRPILIDEAQQLTAAALEAVRDVHDIAKVPVVFAGTDELTLMIDDRARWLGQLRSRISHRYHASIGVAASSPTTGGQSASAPSGGAAGRVKAKPMFTAEELASWFKQQGVRLTGCGVAFLFQIANIPEMGCLRFCQQVVRRARTHRDYREAPLDGRILRAVAAVIHGIRFEHTFEARVDQLRLTAAA